MNTIEILTPVHIGTGNEIESFCYRSIKNNEIARYNFEDIMCQVPQSVLTNPHFLNSFRINANKNKFKKKELYQSILQYVDYKSLDSIYRLVYTPLYQEDIILNYDVSEQIFDLHKPYIPGSSLKGAIFTAWKYKILKDNYGDVLKNFNKLLDKYTTENRRNFNITFPELLFGIKNEAFLSKLYGCLLCDDFYFNDLELFEANRYGTGRDMNGKIPLSYKECIKVGQKSKANFLKIDAFKFERLKNEFTTGIYVNLIRNFNEKYLFEACNEFTKDIIECEKTDLYLDFYKDFEGINKQIDIINQYLYDNNSIVMRVGNSTNYFNKSISYLFKKNSPKLFADNPRVFMPTSKSKPYSIPKTRVIYTNQSFDYLPGFIKVTYD